MGISNLTATAIAIGFTATGYIATGTTAFASCGGNVCRTNATTYGSTSYGSTYSGSTYGMSTSNCPTGTRPSSDGTCLVTGSGATFFGSSRSTNSSYSSGSTSYTSSAPLASYSGQSSWTSRNANVGMSGQDASHKYGSGSISASYTDGSNTIVPFTTTSASISNYRVNGMGANEFLSPTNCPVSVYNPSGAKVLGCYSVSKPAPVSYTVPSVHTVRVVRPIIYVRYPVPTPVPFPVYSGYGQSYSGGCSTGYASRYGNNWPGRPCW